MFYVFRRVEYPALFIDITNVPCSFPPSAGRESWIPAENREMLFDKYSFRKFLHSKTADLGPKHHFVSRWRNIHLKDLYNFDVATATVFILLHIHLKTLTQDCSCRFTSKLFSLPKKRLIQPPTAIFLSSCKLKKRFQFFLFLYVNHV